MIQFNNYSLYKNTESDSFYRGHYEPLDIGFDNSDIYVIIPSEYHKKPGKMAQKLFDSPRLLWVFSVFNRDVISDLTFDFVEGLILRVPTKERLLSYF